ncbi:DUF2147 domain-containing protein [Jhaorihella thermophila]|uniref:Uncharacterized conserved protein, DUF2147 family n=1 Tax=Jhaorihella thermophila TaxID=488547 RepID=A0A1H5YXQ4_9RHOB|nr:DUF2147 domain-containing protein [Jhaorihella thermophila]SEG28590.1 Uncharacterized conserved protein, DUF2147 family [Jhaorihella thermophila]
MRSPESFFAVLAIALVGFATGARATDPLTGTWATPPDGKGIYAHIEVKPCAGPDAGVCGVIARTYDQEDRLVHTRNLGVRILWDMRPEGANEWRGWAYVPLYRKTLKGRISLESRRHIRVGGCIGPVCKSQDWARVW